MWRQWFEKTTILWNDYEMIVHEFGVTTHTISWIFNYTLRTTVLGKVSKEKRQSFWKILYVDIEQRSVIQEVTKLCKNFANLSLQNWRVTREALYFTLPMKLSGMVQKIKIGLLFY